MHRKKLCIAIPASVVSDTPHLREKTSKIGLIGRAAAIFKVEEIIIYPDNPSINQTSEANLISTLLAYMETPQYLRKHLFALKPELRYAGILPPLRTPHHPLNRKMRNLKVGEYREGAIISKTREGALVDIGVEKPALIPNQQLPMGRRVTVKIAKVDRQVEVDLTEREEIPEYWGYKVTVEKSLLNKLVRRGDFGLTIATSKYGVPFASVAKKIFEKWNKAKKILLVFGAPAEGLYEIVRRESFNLNDIFDFVVNTIPGQGTETVRTEEAVVASLAVLNLHFAL
ncbi:MAG: putative RNA uridine N3 methyltransferase [Candidatus Bathycorpusculaceae bacterium]